MFIMRNWLLYFFALMLCVIFLPIAAENTVASRRTSTLTVSQDGKITETDIEEYTLRVLLAEGETCESLEAKKALAVSVRSSAYYISLFGMKHEDFSVCDDHKCCMPLCDPDKAESGYLADCILAVESTRGIVLCDGETPAMALCTLCAGSGTRQCEEFPYLTAVAEPEPCEIHITEKEITFSSLPFGEKVLDESCIVYGDNKKCEFGVFGGKLYSGNEISAFLGLGTTEFVLVSGENGIKAEFFGAGNGYGLSICGAERMAGENFGYEKILEYYFPKLTRKFIYS